MKLKHLIARLQDLNPEADVLVLGEDRAYYVKWVCAGWLPEGWPPMPVYPEREPTPTDTMIVLSY